MLRPSVRAICALLAPSASNDRISRSRAVRPSGSAVGGRCGQQLRSRRPRPGRRRRRARCGSRPRSAAGRPLQQVTPRAGPKRARRRHRRRRPSSAPARPAGRERKEGGRRLDPRSARQVQVHEDHVDPAGRGELDSGLGVTDEPATSTSGSVRSSATSPSRNTGWSSTTRTLTGHRPARGRTAHRRRGERSRSCPWDRSATVSRPPSSSARSRIVCSPLPAAGEPMPRPSSWTRSRTWAPIRSTTTTHSCAPA